MTKHKSGHASVAQASKRLEDKARPERIYPFSAIVGQEAMKQALVLNAVDPGISGVLIRGEKGTAKSTAVRALARLLPEVEVVEGCPFQCHPSRADQQCDGCRGKERRDRERITRPVKMVELPLNATEDRVVGTLSLEDAIRHGTKRFEPGILADANRGILYVDEVNLLDDHIVDVLLDAAAMGVNTVEREGISHTHPARFILVGTMNPEEGELRPQLIDRFGLCVRVAAVPDIESRVELVRRWDDFEADSNRFFASWEDEEDTLQRRISAAQTRLGSTRVPDKIYQLIAEIALAAEVDGHRADLVMLRAARALAAYQQCTDVTSDHVVCVAEPSLAHRVRRGPFEDSTLDLGRVLRVASERTGIAIGEEH